MWFFDRGSINTKILSKKRVKLFAAISISYILATSFMSILALSLWISKDDMVDELISAKQDLFLSEVRYNEVFESAYLETPEAFVLAANQQIDLSSIEEEQNALAAPMQASTKGEKETKLPMQNESLLAVGGDQVVAEKESVNVVKKLENTAPASSQGTAYKNALKEEKSTQTPALAPYEFKDKAGDAFKVSIRKLEKKKGGYKLSYRVENKQKGKRVAGRVFVHVLGTVGSGQGEANKELFFPKQISYDQQSSLAKSIRFAERFRIRRLKAFSQFLQLPKDFEPLKISVVATDLKGKITSVAVKNIESSGVKKSKVKMQPQAHQSKGNPS